jgi:hypothetical protein
MHKSTTLNKLKLLNITNLWHVSIVNELCNRRGASAKIDPLFRATVKRMKTDKNQATKKQFDAAVTKLVSLDLLFEKQASSGLRLHLLTSVWQLEDAIIDSIKSATIGCTLGRRKSINWKTILKEVRKELVSHNIKLSRKVTQTLVRFFLLKQCKWKRLEDDSLIPPKNINKVIAVSPEDQQDLFC